MEQSILKQIWWLKLYALASSIGFAALLVLAFMQWRLPVRVDEIDVERINIVEKDGTLKMVISNATRQHPGLIDGKSVPARQRPAGIIFFNDVGDECGGLVYEGAQKAANLTFSVDQYKNDQVMQLQYDEGLTGPHRSRAYGLRLWDRPETFTLGQLQRRIDSLTRLNDERNRAVYPRCRRQTSHSTIRDWAGKSGYRVA